MAAKALTLVMFVGRKLGRMLDLQQQLDALDGGDGRLGDGRGHATGDEVLGEGHGICERHFWSRLLRPA